MRSPGDKDGLAKNASALVLLQLANYAFPIILMPFLARRLGLIEYGNVAFCLGIVQISAIFTDYGFGLSATYRISKWRHRADYIDKIFCSVFTSKFVLTCLTATVLFVYAMLQRETSLQSLLLVCIFPVASQAILPVWLFQGLERLSLITFITLFSRLAYVIPSLLFIQGPHDSYVALVSLGLANLISGIAGLSLAYGLGHRIRWPGTRFALAVFRDSTQFFISRAAVSMYTSFGTVFLGVVSGPLQVSIYSVAEQGYKAMQGVVGMASQALYPYMVRTRDYGLLFKIIRASILAASIAVITGFAFGDDAISLVFGGGFESSFSVLKVFLLVIAVTTPSVLLGYPFLGALGRLYLANRSVVLAGILQALLLCILYLVGEASAVLVALCVLISEVVVLVCRTVWAVEFNPLKGKVG